MESYRAGGGGKYGCDSSEDKQDGVAQWERSKTKRWHIVHL